jgi:hypothetical protein
VEVLCRPRPAAPETAATGKATVDALTGISRLLVEVSMRLMRAAGRIQGER